jgi:hypothetical protein
MRTFITVVAALTASAAAQSTRDILHTDASGVFLQLDTAPDTTTPFLSRDTRAGVLWTFNDTASIARSVALGNGGQDSWVAHSLNDERLSKFTTTGPGTPDFVYSMLAENPGIIGVDAAPTGSVAAVISFTAGGTVNLRAFTEESGPNPIWTYTFAPAYNNAGQRAVSVSADGGRVAACAYDGTKTLVIYTDAAGTILSSTQITGFTSGLELSADGSRILLTNGANARLLDAATMTEIYNLPVSGAGGYHRISADGSAIAGGGFNIRAAREIAGTWQVVYNANGSQDWFGGGVALSGDGQTLFVLSHNYGAGYLPNNHQVIDLNTGTVLATSGYTGTGAWQNSAIAAQSNTDGTLFACASWGDQGNTMPEVRIYDRDLNLVGSIDTAGSPFELDMDPDGDFILVGSKAVHANTFGSGGNTYAYSNQSACPADLNNDGTLDFFDVQLFLSLFAAQDPAADLNNDGLYDFFDVQEYLNLFATGCP